jgi:hypothetical protein
LDNAFVSNSVDDVVIFLCFLLLHKIGNDFQKKLVPKGGDEEPTGLKNGGFFKTNQLHNGGFAYI